MLGFSADLGETEKGHFVLQHFTPEVMGSEDRLK